MGRSAEHWRAPPASRLAGRALARETGWQAVFWRIEQNVDPEADMRMRVIWSVAAAIAVSSGSAAPALAQTLDVKEWPVEWQGRPRDPAVDPQGRVWFVGQQGNYIGMFDPKTEQFKRYEIEAGTHPHNLIVAQDGGVWYAGNRNARIVRLDPSTGEGKPYMMPDSAARDPHTLIFDGKGNIWFTVQGGGYIGRLNMQSGKVDLLKAGEGRTNPYGIAIDSKGQAWVNLFATNRIAVVDPATFTAKNITVPRETARTRRIAVTSGDVVYYVDYQDGHLGRIQPGS